MTTPKQEILPAQSIPKKKKSGPTPVGQIKCEQLGEDAISEKIIGGQSLTSIAKELNVHAATLIHWIEADPQRSARVRESRRLSAQIWDEKAEDHIAQAGDKFELERARELAHHYRWRAKNVAPREYGDRNTTELTGANGGPIALAAVDMRNLDDKELEQLQTLMAKAKGA